MVILIRLVIEYNHECYSIHRMIGATFGWASLGLALANAGLYLGIRLVGGKPEMTNICDRTTIRNVRPQHAV